MRMRALRAGLIVLSFFLFSGTLEASPSCSVDPFDVTMKQGEFANVTVSWTSDSLFNIYDISVGNLPLSVEGGFSKSDVVRSNGTSKSLPVILQAKSDAQTGSFMVSLIYKYFDEEKKPQESVCQFNLKVNKKASTYNYPSISSDVSRSITNGVVTPVVIPVSSQTPVNVILKRLSRGSSGEEVRKLQEILQKFKFFPEGETLTGYFGPITESAVRALQKERGIDPVGIVGPKTRKVLEELSASSI